MQQATQIQTTSLEITAVSNETKKPNPLVGFFKGVRDKIDGFKSAFKQEQGKDENIKTERPLKQVGKSNDIKKERIAFASERNRPDINDKDILMDKTLFALFLEMLEHLINKKKFAVDDITKELHKNAKLTDEFKEVVVAEIQKRLGKNANLSKELIAASLEKAINESQTLTQEQRDFYLSNLNDKDFMDKFYDILSIKDKETIANKAKSSNELLALVNESFGNNFAKAKEKISESKIDSYMEDMEAKKWQGVTMISNATADEFTREIIAELKANGDLPKSFGVSEDEPSGPRQPRQ